MIEIIKRWYLFLNRHTVVVVWFLYLAPAISLIAGVLMDIQWLVDFVCLAVLAIASTYMIGATNRWSGGVNDEG
jgi:hypothetical protein